MQLYQSVPIQKFLNGKSVKDTTVGSRKAIYQRGAL